MGVTKMRFVSGFAAALVKIFYPLNSAFGPCSKGLKDSLFLGFGRCVSVRRLKIRPRKRIEKWMSASLRY